MEISEKKLPLGMHETSSESLSAKKSYASPTVKVVDFVVEKGFNASPVEPTSSGNIFELEPTEASSFHQNGRTNNQWNTATSGWFDSNN